MGQEDCHQLDPDGFSPAVPDVDKHAQVIGVQEDGHQFNQDGFSPAVPDVDEQAPVIRVQEDGHQLDHDGAGSHQDIEGLDPGQST